MSVSLNGVLAEVQQTLVAVKQIGDALLEKPFSEQAASAYVHGKLEPTIKKVSDDLLILSQGVASVPEELKEKDFDKGVHYQILTEIVELNKKEITKTDVEDYAYYIQAAFTKPVEKISLAIQSTVEIIHHQIRAIQKQGVNQENIHSYFLTIKKALEIFSSHVGIELKLSATEPYQEAQKKIIALNQQMHTLAFENRFVSDVESVHQIAKEMMPIFQEAFHHILTLLDLMECVHDKEALANIQKALCTLINTISLLQILAAQIKDIAEWPNPSYIKDGLVTPMLSYMAGLLDTLSLLLPLDITGPLF